MVEGEERQKWLALRKMEKKSKTYKTYRNLDIEYNLKKGRKEQTEKLRTLTQ